MIARAVIGDRIRQARKAKRLTQTEFGRMLSRPRTHAAVSELERGDVRIDAAELTEIAALLDKDIAYFTAPPETPALASFSLEELVTEIQRRLAPIVISIDSPAPTAGATGGDA